MQVVLKNNNFGEDCYIIGENFDDYDYGDFEEGNMSKRDHDDGDENDEMGMGTWYSCDAVDGDDKKANFEVELGLYVIVTQSVGCKRKLAEPFKVSLKVQTT